MRSNRWHLESLRLVTQLIVRKFCKRKPSINDIRRWPVDPDGIMFLASIKYAGLTMEIRKHPLVRYQDIGCLRSLIRLTKMAVFPRNYSFQKPETENSFIVRGVLTHMVQWLHS
ncbi:fad-binding domain-containing protein [Colletotrichum incanum]|uniref:Fad-binding domain-containing protein n=1 Tax=Colletotrichum incanum TaxID=1573173 RepID=A0A166WLS0_COLIC|nr:fad-binding domain-containing protein [Colletotrichum incanum]